MAPQTDNNPNPQNPLNPQSGTPPLPSFSPHRDDDLPKPVLQPQPPKKGLSRGVKTIFILITALAVIVGGGYSAYALWYNQPKKVTDDALHSALVAKSAGFSGKIEYTPAESGSGNMLTVDYNGQADSENAEINLKMNMDFSPVNINFGTSFISTKSGDLYIKVDKAKDILNTYAGFLGSSVDANPTLKKISNEVDNKWIKMTAADLKELNSSGDDQQVTCVQKAVTDFQNDKTQQEQLYKIFNENRFVSVDKQLGTAKISGRMSQGYQLKFDQKTAENFDKATKQLGVVKALNKCLGDDSHTEAANSSSDTPIPTVEIWADQWDHTLTRVKMSGNDSTSGKLSLTFDPQFNKIVKVQAPTTNITQFKDLKKDFESLFPADMFQSTDLTTNFDTEFNSLEN